jgi:hypothetical protein
MCVIDGMHRLLAARIRGCDTIAVRFFDGDDREAFVTAVRANVGHGLPLSLADREAAASRIVGAYPQWSDRAIAEVTGLAAATVARIRGQVFDGTGRVDARRGRDGRVRPLSSAAGRRIACQIIADRPEASLREVAKEAGISLATAHDVRDRIRRGDAPVPDKEAQMELKHTGDGGEPDRTPEQASALRSDSGRGLALRKLQHDPALRMSEEGRRILRWLAAHSVRPQDEGNLVARIPAHCMQFAVDVAREYAEQWTGIAQALDAAAGHLEE